MATKKPAKPGKPELIGTMAVKDIKMNPANPRLIKDQKFKDLVESIRDFPEMLELRPIILDENDMVLGGNMRLKAVKELGWISVPTKRITGWTDEQKAKFIIKDNVNYGEWDWETLTAEWDTVKLEAWGLDLPAIETERGAKEDDHEIEAEIPTNIKPGDLITIGEHRLVCGDATDPAAYALLMAGDKADLVFTDPPYGVSYKGAQIPGGKQWKGIANDQLRGDELAEFLFMAFEQLHQHSGPGAAAYIWYASKTHVQFELAANEAGFEVKQQLIWNKGMSLGHADYHWAHEPVLYLKKKSGSTTWYGDRTEKTILGPKRSELLSLKKEELVQIIKNLIDGTTTWEIDRERTVTYKHPTQKPVPLAGRAIINSSKERGIVLDAFVGSGTTMVAAHQLGRICYAMDLEPKWCQVTLERMRHLAPEIDVTINGKTLD